MRQYKQLLSDALTYGLSKEDRTGTGTLSLFGYQMRFNLQEGFPLLTTKRLNFDAIVHELLWFLSGDTNIKYLNDHGVHIWDAWADKDGDLGPIYGEQWRNFDGAVDQIAELIYNLRHNPNSRRHVITAWNPADLPDESICPQDNVGLGRMALAPCHCLFQFYVANGRLSCQLYQRSADVFLGVPYNIASYAWLTHIVAQQCDLNVGELIWVGGDTHLYNNHVEQAREQLRRKPYNLPTMFIGMKPETIFDYKAGDFNLINYFAHPHIKGDISV